MQLIKLIIVGGGTAGYVAALILKKRFENNIDISIIKSDKIGIIGVGEGSTEHFKHFIDYVGIDPYELISKTDATCKAGIMFQGWSDQDYLHSVNGLEDLKFGQTLIGYLKLICKNCKQEELNNNLFWKNQISEFCLPENSKQIPVNQYHFNTFKLNEFLNKKSIERKINVFEDEIKEVLLNDKGEIKELIGVKNNYSSDIYIDCTGFKKLLISKLGAKWNSYSKYLKMKEAIAFPTEDTEEYNMYTIAKTMDYGWLFRIPTFGRWGNGYIYDSDYINVDNAKLEVEKIFNKKIEIGRHIKFDPGALDRTWIKNCIAIGLSANFVEPLEATSIGTSIQQTFLLMHILPKYDEKTIEDYNLKTNYIMNNIRDFIVLHYLTNKQNTEFWKNVKKIELPETLKNNLYKWEHRLPIREDFSDTQYLLFFEYNWIHILYGLNLLNIDNLKKHLNFLNTEYVDYCDLIIEKFKKNFSKNPIGHKKYLKIIRGLDV